jgi:hypothetical protein
LTGAAATMDTDSHVQLTALADMLERRNDSVPVLFDREIVFQRTVVDDDLPFAGPDPNAGD